MWGLILVSFINALLLVGVSARRRALSERVSDFDPVHMDITEQVESYNRRRESAAAAHPLDVSFSAFGQDFHLRLQRAYTQWHGLKARVHSSAGTDVVDLADLPIYEGYLSGVPESSVRGRIVDGVFQGVLHTPGETYHVENSRRYFRRSSGDDAFNAIVYKWSDVAFDLPDGTHVCGQDMHDRLRRLREGTVHNMSSSPATDAQTDLKHTQRRATSQINDERNTCTVQLVSDHTFYADMGGQAQTIAAMENILSQTSAIYNRTDFYITDRGIRINLAAAGFDVYTDTSPNNYMSDTNATVEETLQAFSRYNFDNVCVGHLFVHRDFGQGVLGLAWVGDASTLGNAGGICEKQVTAKDLGKVSLNTGVHTNVNFGGTIEEIVQVATMAHEIGHNFGATHDGPGSCSPGPPEGNYIMYPTSTGARMPNNNRFSQCSISEMRSVMDVKGDCFIAYPEAVCGNGRRENDEECDCGANCGPESCCTTECKIVGQCSPLSNDCCTLQCTFANSSVVCRPEGMCTFPATCSGAEAACPRSESKPMTTPCDNGAYLCGDEGTCDRERSVCEAYGVPDCILPDAECEVACVFDGECLSTTFYSFRNSSVASANYSSTRTCDSFTGFCDGQGQCQQAQTHDTINSFTDLFSPANIKKAANFIREYWYYFVAGAGTLLALNIGMCCINHFESRSIDSLVNKRRKTACSTKMTSPLQTRSATAGLSSDPSPILDSTKHSNRPKSVKKTPSTSVAHI